MTMLKKTALMMALLCLLTVFAGCGDKETSSDSSSSLPVISVPTSVALTKIHPGEEWIYDADGFDGVGQHVPFINVNSPEITALNDEIAKTFKEVSGDDKIRNIYYTFMVKNCLLSVYVEVVDDGWFSKGYTYNVSLGDGTVIRDARTMAAYCGLNDEEYRIAAATAVTNEFSALFGSFRDSNGSDFNKNLEKNQSKKMTDTYKGYINERGELSFCGDMYSLDGELRGFSCTSATGMERVQ